ncbi:uncharacterized protein ACIBXB_007776 [Morphnus guianensis]
MPPSTLGPPPSAPWPPPSAPRMPPSAPRPPPSTLWPPPSAPRMPPSTPWPLSSIPRPPSRAPWPPSRSPRRWPASWRLCAPSTSSRPPLGPPITFPLRGDRLVPPGIFCPMVTSLGGAGGDVAGTPTPQAAFGGGPRAPEPLQPRCPPRGKAKGAGVWVRPPSQVTKPHPGPQAEPPQGRKEGGLPRGGVAEPPKTLAQPPPPRWPPFKVVGSCPRRCHCQHRDPPQLPRNVSAWLSPSANHLVEPPWVATLILVGSLVAVSELLAPPAGEEEEKEEGGDA